MRQTRKLWSRSVNCTDAFGRLVSANVSVDTSGRVFVTAPPGETGSFTPDQVIELLGALNAGLGTARGVHSIRKAS